MLGWDEGVDEVFFARIRTKSKECVLPPLTLVKMNGVLHLLLLYKNETKIFRTQVKNSAVNHDASYHFYNKTDQLNKH